MKIYKAHDFERIFYAAMLDWIDSDRQNPDPRGEWEFDAGDTGGFIEGMNKMPGFDSSCVYRWKTIQKRTITINGVVLVAPEVEAPAQGAGYWYESWWGNACADIWRDVPSEDLALTNGKVFLTREDCQAMADAQRKKRLGGGV